MTDSLTDIVDVGLIGPKGTLRTGIPITANALWFNKITSIAVARCPELLADSAISEVAQRRRHLDELIWQWEPLVARVATETGISVCGIKGFPMRTLYQSSDSRDLGDIDVMTESIDDAWRLCQALRGMGFGWSQYELPWLKRDLGTEMIYGQFAVWRWEGDVAIRVDVHFGGYSVRHCGRIPLEVRSGISTLDAVANIPLIVANAAGDFVVRLKDVNDITILLAKFPSRRDWDGPLQHLRAAGLVPFWNSLISIVGRAIRHSEQSSQLLDALYDSTFDEEAVPFGLISPRDRSAATIAHARLVGGDIYGERFARSAERYYSSSLRHSLAETCPHKTGSWLLDEMRNDTCVQLVSREMIHEVVPCSVQSRNASPNGTFTVSEIQGSSILEHVRDDRHSYVRADGEAFVCTVYGDLCREQIGPVQEGKLTDVK